NYFFRLEEKTMILHCNSDEKKLNFFLLKGKNRAKKKARNAFFRKNQPQKTHKLKTSVYLPFTQ
ncbi:MAG: hypothetical protein IIY87_02605, partial [Bacteroidales bacterium]|nr:hypothetical protein [Bacteroidales bacterium]